MNNGTVSLDVPERSETGSCGYSVLSLFSGAGGLDLGFEAQGFRHSACVEINPWCVETLRRNRPDWRVHQMDVRQFVPSQGSSPDVLIAGFPCQGFSLGGNRDEHDERNFLFTEVVRVAEATRPRIVLLENVLNLRTMRVPGTETPFAETIANGFREIGYTVLYDVFPVSRYGVPQTRRRFIFVGFLGSPPVSYRFPIPGPTTTIRELLYDLGQDDSIKLPNHEPKWGFKSAVHFETGEPTAAGEVAVPVRFSRTASDGNPIRSFDEPFPAGIPPRFGDGRRETWPRNGFGRTGNRKSTSGIRTLKSRSGD